MKTSLSLMLSLLFLSACNQGQHSGQQYIQDLSLLISRAEQIDVIEHSSPMDFLDTETGKLLPSQEISYQRATLNKQQKDAFKSRIESLHPQTQDAFPACIPSAHHRIEFFANGKLIDSIELCFECVDVEWNGSTATPPWSLYDGLEAFVNSLGLQARRDWLALAAKSRQ